MQVGAIGTSHLRGARTDRRQGLILLLVRWHRRAATRAALRELPPELLHDVGVTAMDAAHEAARPFWKA